MNSLSRHLNQFLVLAIKSGLLKNASSDEPPLDDSNQNSALTPTTSINNFINVQSKSPRKSRSKSFSNLPLAEFIVNMEKLLKEAGINNVQIEELFSMSNNEFKKFRSSQDFMEKQQKVMGLVRKRCKHTWGGEILIVPLLQGRHFYFFKRTLFYWNTLLFLKVGMTFRSSSDSKSGLLIKLSCDLVF